MVLAAQILLEQSVCHVPTCDQEGKGVSGFNCVRSCVAQRLASCSLTCKLYATRQRLGLGLYTGVAKFLRNSKSIFNSGVRPVPSRGDEFSAVIIPESAFQAKIK